MRKNVEKFTLSYKSFTKTVGFKLDPTFSRVFFRRPLYMPGVSNGHNTCLVVKPQG